MAAYMRGFLYGCAIYAGGAVIYDWYRYPGSRVTALLLAPAHAVKPFVFVTGLAFTVCLAAPTVWTSSIDDLTAVKRLDTWFGQGRTIKHTVGQGKIAWDTLVRDE